MIIIKRTEGPSNWYTYHRSIPTKNTWLNSTNAAQNPAVVDTVTSTTFQFLGSNWGFADGATYVAYLFAHNAGGFGTSGTDNVISCGSFTTGADAECSVSLGYEAQYILFKPTSTTGNWFILDNMRGMPVRNGSVSLYPNTSGAEVVSTGSNLCNLTATGFNTIAANSGLLANTDYIYMAIRRPMKVPTSSTQVFGLNARTGTNANANVTSGAGVSDFAIIKNRGSTPFWLLASRLTGTGYLISNATTSEAVAGATILQANPWDVMDGVKVGTTSGVTNASSNTFINYFIDRASGFFDQVCYTGIDGALNLNHNLGVIPEMMIVKCRSNAATEWQVYHSVLGNTKALRLNSTAVASTGSGFWNNTTPTSSVFTVGNSTDTGYIYTYVAYLFATCPGVSKIGSYTGNGTTQAISCGFTGGARFVLIKRTDSTGDWYVYDTARGMTTLTDPYLLLNSTGAEAATLGSVTTTAGGFTVDATILAAINASGGTYIFLAIA
jgi:hypothetical protein